MKKIILIPILLSILFSFNFALAVDETVNRPGPDETVNEPTRTTTPGNTNSIAKLQNPLNAKSVKDVILLAVDIMVWLGVCFAILAIIWVGFKFVMAQGDPKAISEAKSWFFYIIIGLAILISAKVIVEIVQNTLTKAGVVNENAWTPPR